MQGYYELTQVVQGKESEKSSGFKLKFTRELDPSEALEDVASSKRVPREGRLMFEQEGGDKYNVRGILEVAQNFVAGKEVLTFLAANEITVALQPWDLHGFFTLLGFELKLQFDPDQKELFDGEEAA